MIKGFPARKKKPQSLEPPRPKLTCPHCRQEAEAYPAEDVEDLELDPFQVSIHGCGACEVVTAHVEGIQDVWRHCTKPEDLDVVIQDAWDGLRQRHFLTSDAMDPMWWPL